MKSDSAAYGVAFPLKGRGYKPRATSVHDHRKGFFLAKRTIDLVFAVLALPMLVVLTVVLYLANPFMNPGPVFFRQVRMGQDGRAFRIWKFRTMTGGHADLRAADAPLDEYRITRLGRLLRRTKLDELPNILNILSGEMSLVGPRPDAFQHATAYLADVPRYDKRFVVRPGITGLAQVRGGYADNPRAVQRKARYDCFYIKHSSFLLELYVIAATFAVVFSGFGQR